MEIKKTAASIGENARRRVDPADSDRATVEMEETAAEIETGVGAGESAERDREWATRRGCRVKNKTKGGPIFLLKKLKLL